MKRLVILVVLLLLVASPVLAGDPLDTNDRPQSVQLDMPDVGHMDLNDKEYYVVEVTSVKTWLLRIWFFIREAPLEGDH